MVRARAEGGGERETNEATQNTPHGPQPCASTPDLLPRPHPFVGSNCFSRRAGRPPSRGMRRERGMARKEGRVCAHPTPQARGVQPRSMPPPAPPPPPPRATAAGPARPRHAGRPSPAGARFAAFPLTPREREKERERGWERCAHPVLSLSSHYLPSTHPVSSFFCFRTWRRPAPPAPRTWRAAPSRAWPGTGTAGRRPARR